MESEDTNFSVEVDAEESSCELYIPEQPQDQGFSQTQMAFVSFLTRVVQMVSIQKLDHSVPHNILSPFLYIFI